MQGEEERNAEMQPLDYHIDNIYNSCNNCVIYIN